MWHYLNCYILWLKDSFISIFMALTKSKSFPLSFSVSLHNSYWTNLRFLGEWSTQWNQDSIFKTILMFQHGWALCILKSELLSVKFLAFHLFHKSLAFRIYYFVITHKFLILSSIFMKTLSMALLLFHVSTHILLLWFKMIKMVLLLVTVLVRNVTFRLHWQLLCNDSFGLIHLEIKWSQHCLQAPLLIVYNFYLLSIKSGYALFVCKFMIWNVKILFNEPHQ